MQVNMMIFVNLLVCQSFTFLSLNLPKMETTHTFCEVTGKACLNHPLVKEFTLVARINLCTPFGFSNVQSDCEKNHVV